MTEKAYDANDPAFLASRHLDEALSPYEQKRLDDALTASAELRAEAVGLRTINELVRRWGTAEVELDWAAHRKLIEAAVLLEPEDAKDRKLEELLQHCARGQAELDEERFAERVMAQVRSRSGRARLGGVVFRLVSPLAAAAAIALMVVGTWWYHTSIKPHAEVSISRWAGGTGAAMSSERVRIAVVSFSHAAAADWSAKNEGPGISFLLVGAAQPGDEAGNEPPPL